MVFISSNLLLFKNKIQSKILVTRLHYKTIWYFFDAKINGWVIKGKDSKNLL